MNLLVKRDITLLGRAKGTSTATDVPKFLQKPRVVIPALVTVLNNRDEDDDLLIAGDDDAKEINEHLQKYEVSDSMVKKLYHQITNFIKVPAIWSGYRSVLTKDISTKDLYRIKGLALNYENPEITEFEDGNFWIQGGQKNQNAIYEKQMSSKFNSVLKQEGVEPVMEFKGLWKYPNRVKRHVPAASIYKVKGDTRLDELMFVLEGLASLKFGQLINRKRGERFIEIRRDDMNRNGRKFLNRLSELYFKIGYITGQLKKTMDVNNQSWSCDSYRSNAHIGNIVLYNDMKYTNVNFVDFDASWDLRDCTISELRDIQKNEYNTIIKSALKLISMREIQGKPLLGVAFFHTTRAEFANGFSKGYSNSNSVLFSKLDSEIILELFYLLRLPSDFELEKVKIMPESLIDHMKIIYEADYGITGKRMTSSGHHTQSLDYVILKNKDYQDNLTNHLDTDILYKYGKVQNSGVRKYLNNVVRTQNLYNPKSA